MGGTYGPSKLPEGYRLDLADDPDAPALRRPDGSVAARFSARGMMHEAVEREALEDLLRTRREPRGEQTRVTSRLTPEDSDVPRPRLFTRGRGTPES